MKAQPFTSCFLSGTSVATRRDLGRVLVLGGDWIGSELAERLCRNGFEVILLGQSEKDVSPSMTVMASATLEELQGFVGDFTAVLHTPTGTVHERVGSVVAAGPARLVAKYDDYRLAGSDRVVSLSDLEERLQNGDALTPRQGDWLHVAFFCGLKGESHPAVFSRVLHALERLSSMEKVQAYVFTKNLKVAGPGLEAQYRESRERGDLYFKFDEDRLSVTSEHGRTALVFQDPLLGEEVGLIPDVLVVDENMLPPDSLTAIVQAIPSSPAFEPFVQPESIRFPGVHTPKAGIYAVGPSRGLFSEEMIRGDIDAVVAALNEPASAHNRSAWDTPQVDAGRCTMCLTCVRLCPHGAMSFREKAEADPLSCVRCGICAAECPMAAITLPRQKREGLGERADNGNALVPETCKGIVAFLCERSAGDAFKGIQPALVKDVTVIPVPCAGTVSVLHILNALEKGAAGVLVAGCYQGNCASIYGTVLAAQRSARTRGLLEEAGVQPGRVLFTSCASNAPGNLIAALRDLRESVRGVGNMAKYGADA